MKIAHDLAGITKQLLLSVTVPPRLANAICGPVLFVLYIDNYSLNKGFEKV